MESPHFLLGVFQLSPQKKPQECPPNTTAVYNKSFKVALEIASNCSPLTLPSKSLHSLTTVSHDVTLSVSSASKDTSCKKNVSAKHSWTCGVEIYFFMRRSCILPKPSCSRCHMAWYLISKELKLKDAKYSYPLLLQYFRHVFCPFQVFHISAGIAALIPCWENSDWIMGVPQGQWECFKVRHRGGISEV